jgi:hypothetical protein
MAARTKVGSRALTVGPWTTGASQGSYPESEGSLKSCHASGYSWGAQPGENVWELCICMGNWPECSEQMSTGLLSDSLTQWQT